MKLTIIAEDKSVTKDGTCVPDIDMSSWLPTDVWAVNWDSETSTGEIEYNDGKPNVAINEIGIYSQAVTDFDKALPDAEETKLRGFVLTPINSLRVLRDNKLAESDWTQFTDSPLADAKKTEWATYRQKLRDLPATETDYENPTWPTEPT
tara:strand:- start:923 stop:1372 length:450 start_codon:yes stop_codon:yes gene_type:complete